MTDTLEDARQWMQISLERGEAAARWEASLNDTPRWKFWVRRTKREQMRYNDSLSDMAYWRYLVEMKKLKDTLSNCACDCGCSVTVDKGQIMCTRCAYERCKS